MREINKGPEPKELTQYKVQPNAVYDGPNFTPVKQKIRKNLLSEQGVICAYCMDRITELTMKIEHWSCQHSSQELQLEYNNLLGCCKGHEGSRPLEQTCDTKKGSSSIKYSPANPEHRLNTKIQYSRDGKILSSDDEFNQQLDKILNLNKPRIISNRLHSIQKIQDLLNNKKGRRSKSEIRKLLNKILEKKDDGTYIPYYGAMVFYLESKLM
ncbi:TIGR02646 family protein [Photorhabdus khanii]|uniref:TIGR02646 family protein n=1 Tax=Photorhabdus khanii TaxID=1004150 RepID=A0A7C9GLZ2_9GAMM|nr:retron system putative HNH endonuclease [Photorhabdus khanii]MQL49112.1 TIGR02646 family protein [Photorhabdus khanii]